MQFSPTAMQFSPTASERRERNRQPPTASTTETKMTGRDQNPWYSDTRRRPHHDLDVWHSAKELSLQIYRVTDAFPDEEKFGLVAQLRRAGVSVASNIAEGAARRTDSDFLRFLYMARGSMNEIDTQLEVAGELGFLDSLEITELRQAFDDTSGSLQGLISTIQRDIE
jgi:four helix bundle protein